MKAKSILFGMCLLSSLSLAKDFGWVSVNFGGELQGLLISDSWHTRSTATSKHLDALVVSVSNASGYSYQQAGDKLSNYILAGRFTARTEFESGVKLLFALGLESGMKDGKSYRPIDPAGDSVSVTLTEWDDQASTAVSTWKNKSTVSPVFYMGYGLLSFGVGLDKREFKISGHDPALSTYLDVSISDSQYIYGIRAEQAYEWFDKNVTVSFEFMTNFGRESDKDTKIYFQNLAKYGMDMELDAAPEIIGSSGVLDGNGYSTGVENRAKVYSVNTNLMKISVGVGIELIGS